MVSNRCGVPDTLFVVAGEIGNLMGFKTRYDGQVYHESEPGNPDESPGNNDGSSNVIRDNNNSPNIPVLHQRVFYHATTKNNAKDLVNDGKFDHDRIGEATAKRSSGGFFSHSGPNSGTGFYVAKDKETTESYGGTIIEIKLNDDAEILDLQPYWLKGDDTPKLPFLDYYREWKQNDMIEYWENNPNERDEEMRNKILDYWKNDMDDHMNKIDPRNKTRMMDGTFDPYEFIQNMRTFAEAHGFAGINYDSNDTVIFDNDSIESMRIVR